MFMAKASLFQLPDILYHETLFLMLENDLLARDRGLSLFRVLQLRRGSLWAQMSALTWCPCRHHSMHSDKGYAMYSPM